MKTFRMQRESIRLKDYDYSQPGHYYVTLCTKNRECLLSEITVGAGPCAGPKVENMDA